jgi:outer membrane protein assembly factor BamB
MKRALTLLALTAAISGCATIKGWFNDTKKENIEPPTPLVEFAPTVNVQKMWSQRVGKGAGESGATLPPTYADGKIYASSTNGDVAAIEADSGHVVWQKHYGQSHGFIWHHGDNSLRWSGGPAVNGDQLVVGGLDGQVQALATSDGAERWQVQVSSEVIAPPAIDSGVVIVRTNDGRVYGLNEKDGSRLWVYDRSSVPILSLRGNSAPQASGGVVFNGEDNGKVVALRANDGGILWEQLIASGEGRGELERIQDVDGKVVVSSGVVYAAGYRGQVAALIAQSGRPLWTHELSSYTGVALSASQLYVADADSNIHALDLRSGSSEWKQDGLQYRWVSEPAVQGETVVVGDLEGFVHWMSISDGKFVARTRLAKEPIHAAPLVVGDVVYVEDVEGEIGAYRVGK